MSLRKKSKVRRRLKSQIPVVIILSLILSLSIGGVAYSKVDSRPSELVQQTSEYPSNWYEDSQLPVGNWYEDVHNVIYVEGYRVSFLKIYSLGSPLRVAELSTYPRAYKDMDPHVYEVDTPFTVTPTDAIWIYEAALYGSGEGWPHPRDGIAEGTRIYIDYYNYIFLVGETAVHYAGEPLPGAFPDWIASETLPTPSWVDQKNSVFPIVVGTMLGELSEVIIYEGVWRDQDDTEWSILPQDWLDEYYNQISTGEIKVTKLIKNKDRNILRIIYDRVIF